MNLLEGCHDAKKGIKQIHMRKIITDEKDIEYGMRN